MIVEKLDGKKGERLKIAEAAETKTYPSPSKMSKTLCLLVSYFNAQLLLSIFVFLHRKYGSKSLRRYNYDINVHTLDHDYTSYIMGMLKIVTRKIVII